MRGRGGGVERYGEEVRRRSLLLTLWDLHCRFYAAMYALKGRENRRTATALKQLSGVDLGGKPAGETARGALDPRGVRGVCGVASYLVCWCAGGVPRGHLGRTLILVRDACDPAPRRLQLTKHQRAPWPWRSRTGTSSRLPFPMSRIVASSAPTATATRTSR
jgi:hypothetical protein